MQRGRARPRAALQSNSAPSCLPHSQHIPGQHPPFPIKCSKAHLFRNTSLKGEEQKAVRQREAALTAHTYCGGRGGIKRRVKKRGKSQKERQQRQQSGSSESPGPGGECCCPAKSLTGAAPAQGPEGLHPGGEQNSRMQRGTGGMSAEKLGIRAEISHHLRKVHRMPLQQHLILKLPGDRTSPLLGARVTRTENMTLN